MNRTLQDWLDYLKATEPLLNPNHAYTSERMLARRFQGASGEDRLPRLFDRLADVMNGPLVTMNGRKLALTPLGLATRGVLQRLVALRNREVESDPVEVLTLAVAASILPGLHALLAVAFLREWAGLVRLRLVLLDPETIREQITSGAVAFAIGLRTDAADAEPIQGEALAWSILAHRDHPLARKQGPIVADDMAEQRIVLPPWAAVAPGIAEFLSRIHPANHIDALSREAVNQIAATGIAVALDLDFANRSEPDDNLLCRLPIAGLEPEQIVLCLPRNPNDLSEPAKFLVEQIRAAVRDAALPIPPLPPLPSFDLPALDLLPEIPPLPEPQSA